MKGRITDTTPFQAGPARNVIIQINTGFTGTVKIIDGTSGTTTNVALLINPQAGAIYQYWDFTQGVRVIADAACDITVGAR